MNIRSYREEDEPAIQTFGAVAAGFRDAVVLRLVAGEPAVAHLYIVDRGTTALKRTGVCDMFLDVAPQHRNKGIGSALHDRALAFASERRAQRIKTWTDADKPETLRFLHARGWTETEREYPSRLDTGTFDPELLLPAIEHVQRQAIRLFSYAEAGDTEENRHKLHTLITTIKSNHTWQESVPDAQEPYDYWLQEMEGWPQETILLAESDGEWVGVTTRPHWPYTGVLPQYQSRGIATALKACQIALHKTSGSEPAIIETENHSHNAPMLAVNRKLGYVFGTPSVTLQKVLTAP